MPMVRTATGALPNFDRSGLKVMVFGDMIEKPLHHIGIISSIYAIFQIVVVISPNLATAWSAMLVLIPVVTGLVLAYVFITALVYLGFHPTLVRKLNIALEESNLPKYKIERSKGHMALIPPKRHLEQHD